MLASVLAASLAFGASVVAQSSTVLCVAGQCLQGYSNTTLGATLSASGISTGVLLLPGQYTSSSNPELLHDLLTSSSATLSPSAGFANSTANTSVTLPLTVQLQPGIATYPEAFYAGKGSYTGLTSANTSTSLNSLGSIALAGNVWAEVTAGSNSRVILWNSIPDVSQLPTTASGSLSLLRVESSTCSPPCSGNGVCTASGTCSCPTGFSGSSCEQCASGYYGSSCQPCPAGCTSCDDGISGSGRCLSTTVTNPPSSCNCINGECGSNGQCSCLPGWTSASNGTQCAACASGYFLDSSGNCEICQLGCSECADSSGDCITCKSGFTQDANDRTKCDAVQQTTSSGTTCPDGSYSNGTSCEPCAPECQTCTGGTSNNCVICASGTYSLNGSCVQTNSGGVCQGTSLLANNNKRECDSEYPSVRYERSSGAYRMLLREVLTACDSSCSTCVGSASYCLTCANNMLASSGQCVSSCPSNTFSSSGACIPCHPDCATCSGASFNQCSSCSKTLPVLTNGRCLATCSQNQYLDTTSSTCQNCDSSCSSCSGPGPSNCLACSSSSQVLRGGACVAANCSSDSSVVPGLGACLSELVLVPSSSGSSSAPLPSISGLSSPVTTSTHQSLQWWEILLMTLGCAFIFMAFLWCWRRRARKQRAKATAAFASAKALDRPTNWRARLMRLFGQTPKQPPPNSEEIALWKLRAAEEARHDREIEKLIGAYEYPRTGSSRGPSPLPSLYDGKPAGPGPGSHDYDAHSSHRLSRESMYSQVTGLPRNAPEPRQPVKSHLLTSRFSTTTVASSVYKKPSVLHKRELTPPKPPSDAEAYAASVRQPAEEGGSAAYWLVPVNTGGSRNPFRKS
ncbi:hypothetical protein ID866_6313 [Astraeus odoratus]|nr:hypothetical protein ID866_6313 [Astraeus odoratus]